MKRANVLNEIVLDLQAYDLSHVEQTIMRLNARIANLPAEARVRFEPCGKCGIILTPGTKNAEHARDCIFPALKWKRHQKVETNPEWDQEDVDYAMQCEYEKMESQYR